MFGLALLWKIAFNLMVPFVVAFPLTCITMGARYSRSVFWLSIAFTLIVVTYTAPEGYFKSRPVVFMLAAGVLVGFPLTVVRLLHSLREVSVEAIAARDTQSRFLAMMSHELRTPINSIVNAAGLIDAANLPKDQRDLLSLIKPNAVVLLSRVDDVLDVAAINSGTFHLHAAPFEIVGMAKMVRTVVSTMAMEKGIELYVSVGSDVPKVIIGDARRITQVLGNLASNAVKYTPRGGKVWIEVMDEPGAPQGFSTLLMSVSDTGIGIQDDQKSKIFEAFHQVSQGDTRAHDGVGLGLHIVKVISDRMGGSLKVTDRPGGSGSIFQWRITLPLAGAGERVSEALEMLDMLKIHRLRTPSRTCLVIDDNLSNLEIMRRILELGGHRIYTATNGEDGLARLREGGIDICYLDLHMPGMSGWDVLAAHQSMNSRENPAKIVILSALTDIDSQRRALEMGAVAYLRKPVAADELLESLVKLGPVHSLLSDMNKDLSHSTHLDVMRSIASLSDIRTWLVSFYDELNDCRTDLLNGWKVDVPSQQIEHAHRLKNMLLGYGRTEGATHCQNVITKIRAGQIGNEQDLQALLSHAEAAMSEIVREKEFPAGSRDPGAGKSIISLDHEKNRFFIN